MGIKELMANMEQDTAFAGNYKGLIDFSKFIEQAKKDGYEISTKDVFSALTGKELSDSDLDAVAGGFSMIIGRFSFDK